MIVTSESRLTQQADRETSDREIVDMSFESELDSIWCVGQKANSDITRPLSPPQVIGIRIGETGHGDAAEREHKPYRWGSRQSLRLEHLALRNIGARTPHPTAALRKRVRMA